jgi:hypothetical protein
VATNPSVDIPTEVVEGTVVTSVILHCIRYGVADNHEYETLEEAESSVEYLVDASLCCPIAIEIEGEIVRFRPFSEGWRRPTAEEAVGVREELLRHAPRPA